MQVGERNRKFALLLRTFDRQIATVYARCKPRLDTLGVVDIRTHAHSVDRVVRSEEGLLADLTNLSLTLLRLALLQHDKLVIQFLLLNHGLLLQLYGFFLLTVQSLSLESVKYYLLLSSLLFSSLFLDGFLMSNFGCSLLFLAKNLRLLSLHSLHPFPFLFRGLSFIFQLFLLPLQEKISLL